MLFKLVHQCTRVNMRELVRRYVCKPRPSRILRRDVRAECRLWASVVEMAALRQEHRYGLSCSKINKNTPNQSLYHVKLTDTAIRTLEAYQNLKVRKKYKLKVAYVAFFMNDFPPFYRVQTSVTD